MARNCKRLGPFVLAILAVLALAGCGGSGSSGRIGVGDAGRGILLNYSLLEEYTEFGMNSVLTYAGSSYSADYEVKLYKISYQSIDTNGNPITLSGAVAIPDGTTSGSLISYQHSTATERSNVPSGNNDEIWFVSAIYASSGNYVVAAADYIGLGDDTSHFHPYVHAASEASASLDCIRAARTLCQRLGFTLDSKLFLAGYSQGGHSTMALTQTIDNLNSTEFQPLASAPMSGPYDLSDTQLDYAFNDPSADAPTFLAYVTLAYQKVYGNVYSAPAAAFISPYDTQVFTLFNGQNDLTQIADQLPSQPSNLFQPSFVSGVLGTDPNAFRADLVLNDNYNWKPTTPMQIYASTGDEVVSYQNAVKVVNAMKALGATNVELVDIPGAPTHLNGIYKALPMARAWFDQLAGY